MNILIAPNAFKNSLDAQAVAEAIELGLMQSNLDCNCQLFPVADGGDGTGDLIIKKLNGELIKAPVHDALGRPIIVTYGLIDNGQTAVIEMANASGLRLLAIDELNPMLANSVGTGELMMHALNKGVNNFIVGMGGSATVDGGAGILAALGIKFYGEGDKELKPIPEELIDLIKVDVTGIDSRIYNCSISILCDVDNTLLGSEGAAAVFGPQKGATPANVVKLDAMLATFAAVTLAQTGNDMATIKHSGTAGGAAAGLYAFLNAQLVNGANTFLELTGFETALQNADIVITGEGSIDEQTLQCKAPAAVAAHAKKQGLKVISLAGKVPQEHSEALNEYFDILRSINAEPVDLQTALKNTRANLIRTAKEIGDSLATS